MKKPVKKTKPAKAPADAPKTGLPRTGKLKTVNKPKIGSLQQSSVQAVQSGQALRKRAEMIARETADQSPENIDTMSTAEIRQMIHELRVHQIQLDMQNEELHRSQVELEEARSRYFDLYDMAPVGYLTLSEKGLILEANLTASTLLGVPRGELVKKTLSCFILREDQDSYYLHHKKLSQTGGPQVCNLRMVKKGGAEFWAHMEASAVQTEGDVPVYHVVLMDITVLKQVEETRILNDSLSKILNGIDGVVYVTDMKTYEVVFVNTYGENIWGDIQGKICWQTIQAGKNGPCEFCTNGKLLRTDGKPTEGVVWEFQNTVNKRWYNCRDRAIYWPDGRIVRMEIATDITERKAMMLELESSYQQLRVLNRRWVEIEELERKRLSAELHDEIGQNLTALGINFGILKMSLPPDTESNVYDRIDDSINLLKRSSVHMKSIMSNLRPTLLDDYGLVPALHWYAQESAKRTGIKISCVAEELQCRPNAEIETALFRIAQEAVNNSVKHAHAKRIRLTLKHEGNRLSLVITDNGIGFDMQATPGHGSHGWGLMIIRERCAGIKGISHIESKPDRGTKISIEVPL